MLWDMNLTEQDTARPVRFFADSAHWDRLEAMRAFMASAPAAHPSRFAVAFKPKRGAGVYPYPKVTADLSDGSSLTLSVWVDAKKPDLEAASRSVHAIARAHGLGVIRTMATGIPMPTAKTAKDSAATKLAALVRALKARDIETAIRLADLA